MVCVYQLRCPVVGRCRSFQTSAVKNVNWEAENWADKQTRGLFFLDVVPPHGLSAAATTPQIAANVGRQQPAAVPGLPPAFPCYPPTHRPAHPVAVAQPAYHALQPAVQRQPGGPQPYQLAGLHPWGVLPASDRTHQRGRHPGTWGTVAVGRQGARLLHRRPEGALYFSPPNLLNWFYSFALKCFCLATKKISQNSHFDSSPHVLRKFFPSFLVEVGWTTSQRVRRLYFGHEHCQCNQLYHSNSGGLPVSATVAPGEAALASRHHWSSAFTPLLYIHVICLKK